MGEGVANGGDDACPIANGRLTEEPRLRTPGARFLRETPAPVRPEWQHDPDRAPERPSAPARCTTDVSIAMVKSTSAAMAAVSLMSLSASPTWVTLLWRARRSASLSRLSACSTQPDM